METGPIIIILSGILAMGWGFGVVMRNMQYTHLRNTYAKLTQEKLDVIRSAINMGYQAADLRELDARLEKLIGHDKELMKMLPPLDAEQQQAQQRVLEVEMKNMELNREGARSGRQKDEEDD